jgi:linoleoyl-CoA desaturase
MCYDAASHAAVRVTAVAVVKDRCASSVTFADRVGFRQAVGERVEAHLRDNGLRPTDLPAMYVKTAAILAWWLVVYLLILLGGFSWPVNLALCLLWALAIAGVGFNVMHDANHGGYSSRPAVNRLFGLTAELLGISGFRWRTKHNVWHHTYTNIAGLDDDVETYGTMRLSPHEAWKPWHRLQAAYFPLIYSLIGLDFMLRDFLMIFFGRSDEHHVYPRLSARDKLVFWAGKLCFATIMVGLPLLVFPWWQVVIGFFVVLLAAGFVLGLVFELAHIMEVADFPEPTDDPLRIDNEWAVHQVETSVDFAPRNRLLG